MARKINVVVVALFHGEREGSSIEICGRIDLTIPFETSAKRNQGRRVMRILLHGKLEILTLGVSSRDRTCMPRQGRSFQPIAIRNRLSDPLIQHRNRPTWIGEDVGHGLSQDVRVLAHRF